MINKIYIVNGPNLNLVGKREPEIYGTTPVDEYIDSIRGGYLMALIDYYQSNHEGDLIDYLQEHGFEEHSGIVLNAGALTHTSIALRDTIAAIEVPVVEVHITDISRREAFRKHSYVTDVCIESIIGKGLEGYRMAIDRLLEQKNSETEEQ